MIKYFFLWFPMLVLAIINGATRDLWYKKRLGELAAHQLSTITLVILFGIYIQSVISKFPPASFSHAVLIGVLWVALTLAFEFGFGLLRGNSFQILLNDYNLAKGRLWILVPLSLAIMPVIFYTLK